MNLWESIRQLARKKRTEIDLLAKGENAEDLLAAIAVVTNIPCVGLPADDPLLYGAEAVLDPESERIWYNREVDPPLLIVYKIHEYAHYWIEGQIVACNHPDLAARLSEEKSPLGVDRVESYSPKERREAQANVYAREFLLPAERLRNWFIQERWSASKIAQYVGVPESLVFHQLTDVLLLPTIPEKQARFRHTLGAGGLAVFFSLVLVVTGALEMFHYVPTPPEAGPSVQTITYFVPLGGLGEVGKNMMALEYEDSILVVDCGLMFPDDEMFGIDFVIPDIAYLEERKSELLAKKEEIEQASANQEESTK